MTTNGPRDDLMPFIITTSRSCPACVHGPAGGGEHRPESTSRCAVATLDEARAVMLQPLVRAVAHPVVRGDLARIVERWDGSEALALRLPDKMIYVERSTWGDLATAVGFELRWDPPTIDGDYLHDDQRRELEGVLVAYNAAGGPA